LIPSLKVRALRPSSRSSVNQLPARSLVPHVEFLDRFERKELEQAAGGVVAVVAAVDDVVDVPPVAAADLRTVLGALALIRVKTQADSGNRRRQVGELAPVERQALDARRLDDLSDRR